MTRDYESIQPWLSVRQHMDEIAFETAAGGALYFVVAQIRHGRDEDVQRIPRPG